MSKRPRSTDTDDDVDTDYRLTPPKTAKTTETPERLLELYRAMTTQENHASFFASLALPDALALLNHCCYVADVRLYRMYLLVRHLKANGTPLGSLIPTSEIFKAVTAMEVGRLVALIVMLTIEGYDSLAHQFTRQIDQSSQSSAVTTVKRLLLSSSACIADHKFWMMFLTATSVDPAWSAVCRAKRASLSSCGNLLPPPPEEIVLAMVTSKLPDEECQQVHAFVATLCTDGLKSAEVARNAWLWIDRFNFVGLYKDQFGAIVQLAIQKNERARIDKIVAYGGFQRFAMRTALNAIWKKMEDAPGQTPVGDQMMVAASVRAAAQDPNGSMMPSSTYEGLASCLFRMALHAKDSEMFANTIRIANSLGPVHGISEIVKLLVAHGDVQCFDQFVRLQTIEISRVWRSFVAVIKGTESAEMEMFKCFLTLRADWVVENRAQMSKALERRELMEYVCEFAKFISKNVADVDKTSILDSALDALKRFGKSKELGNTISLCVACGDIADHTLKCGHRVGCGTCIEKLVDTMATEENGQRPACPLCRAVVDKTQADWRIKLKG